MAHFNYSRFEMFKSQNLEEGYFDMKFVVEEKTIYAHKFMLATVSEVLKAMISDIWNTGEFIKIETYSYKDFYEFLTFLLSGNCELNDENIFSMVDLSEFYQVKSLQQKCDEFLSRKEYTSQNVLVFIEKYLNYSLPLFEKALSKCFERKFMHLFESEGFLEFSKEIVKKIVSFEKRFVSEERLFENVYEWAENRAIKKREELIDEALNFNDAIKSEIRDILPYEKFKKMNYKFLYKCFDERRFLFTNFEWNEILENAKSDKKVKVINANGKSIFCMLSYKLDVIEKVKTLKICPSSGNTTELVYWNTKFPIPSTPSQLTKRNDVEWYLIYWNDGRIGVMKHNYISDFHYLIAEMTAEIDDFDITQNCNIEIE